MTRLRQAKPEVLVAESIVREYVRQRKPRWACWDTRFSSPQSYMFGSKAQVAIQQYRQLARAQLDRAASC